MNHSPISAMQGAKQNHPRENLKDNKDEQAGFRQNTSCTDQKATLRIIAEQSI